jgi:hypothetical protein
MSVKYGLYEKNKLQLLQRALLEIIWPKENAASTPGQDYCEHNTELRCIIQVAQ